jgi:hypothetical protein
MFSCGQIDITEVKFHLLDDLPCIGIVQAGLLRLPRARRPLLILAHRGGAPLILAALVVLLVPRLVVLVRQVVVVVMRLVVVLLVVVRPAAVGVAAVVLGGGSGLICAGQRWGSRSRGEIKLVTRPEESAPTREIWVDKHGRIRT